MKWSPVFNDDGRIDGSSDNTWLIRGMVQKGVRYRCAKHPAGRSGNGT